MAVLGATFGILQRFGLAAVTIGKVAEISGVHETTIYRRWRTPAALAFDASMQFAASSVGHPDTGTLRGDLTAFVRGVAAAMESPAGRALLEVCRLPDTDVVEARRQFFRKRFGEASKIFERAVDRGEITQPRDPHALIELLIAPLYFRALVTGEPLKAWHNDSATDIVASALARREQSKGVRAGGAQTRRDRPRDP